MQIYEHCGTPEVFMLPSDVVQLASQPDLGCSVLRKRVDVKQILANDIKTCHMHS